MARKAMFATRSPKRKVPRAVARSVKDEAAALAFPVLDVACALVAKVHSQGERYVQQGRLIVLIGRAGAKNGTNSY
jgi:4-hydroxy-3-methylbut-2-enyl diphosphate reductase IspH